MARRSLTAIFAALLLVSAAVTASADPSQPGGTFVDDDGNVHEGSIEAIASEGITQGCNPPANDRFCPDRAVSRGEMAAFLVRALDLPAGPAGRFVDDDDSIFRADVEALAAAGITLGCNPPINDRFCPDEPVERGEMAAFIVRAMRLPPGPAGRFVDDDASVFEADIEALAEAGITLGCNPPGNDRFCPTQAVTRAEMATFLTRMLGLTPMTPPARCTILPADSILNRRVDDLPVHARSSQYVAAIGNDSTVHADFGSGVWPPGSTSPIGIPSAEVLGDQERVSIHFTAYGSESDPGPYPIPPDAPIEGGPDSNGDRHVLVVDTENCMLYELGRAFPRSDGSWDAQVGVVFDLTSNDLRPDTWTSADAAGLPMYPLLVRYDEVASGRITHAIRFTAPSTQKAHVWPARHDASSLTGLDYPPMGQRFRLEADFDISGFSPEVQVILRALKEYGMVLADNGASWFLSGEPDSRWNNDDLHQLGTIPGSAFEAVDVSSLMVDPDSGAVSH
jgi:hypothetical protein